MRNNSRNHEPLSLEFELLREIAREIPSQALDAAINRAAAMPLVATRAHEFDNLSAAVRLINLTARAGGRS